MNTKDAVIPGSAHTFTVGADHQHTRLDVYLAQAFAGYSRSFLKDLIIQKCVEVNTKNQTKPSYLLNQGDTITITFPEKPTASLAEIKAKGCEIEIVYEHEHFLIINKPAHLIMHHAPSTAGKPTLVDWILLHESAIAQVGLIDRPGIVHRLDKDTSGLLIIARTNYAHTQFTKLFEQRAIHKTYRALVQGHPPEQGSIDFAIGRNQTQKHKMAAFTPSTTQGNYRTALTHYRVLNYFDTYSLVELTPITGRTHQIRVHCAAIGHPLLGDATYNTNPISISLDRHALHAYALSFAFDGTPFNFTCPLPDDMAKWLI